MPGTPYSWGRLPAPPLRLLFDAAAQLFLGSEGSFAEPVVSTFAHELVDNNYNVILSYQQILVLIAMVENGLTNFTGYSFAGTQSTLFEMNQGQINQKLTVTLAGGSGPYTATIVLSPINALAGAEMEAQIIFPPNTSNPTVTIVDGQTSAVLYSSTDQNNSDAYTELPKFVFNGSSWIYWGP